MPSGIDSPVQSGLTPAIAGCELQLAYRPPPTNTSRAPNSSNATPDARFAKTSPWKRERLWLLTDSASYAGVNAASTRTSNPKDTFSSANAFHHVRYRLPRNGPVASPELTIGTRKVPE